jgi:hypothetical protein
MSEAIPEVSPVIHIFNTLNRKIAADGELRQLLQGFVDWCAASEAATPAGAGDESGNANSLNPANDPSKNTETPHTSANEDDDWVSAIEIATALEKRVALIAAWLASGKAPSDWLLSQLEYSSYRLRGLESAYRTLAAGLRASQFDRRGLEIAALAQNMVLHWIETLALRIGIFDHEQRSAFRWLRHQGERRQQFLYGLSKDHKVELTQAAALLQEAEAILAAHQPSSTNSDADNNTKGDQLSSPANEPPPALSPEAKAQQALLKKVGFHRKKLTEGDEREWPKLLPLLAQLAERDLEATRAELALLRQQKIPLALLGQFIALRERAGQAPVVEAGSDASGDANGSPSDVSTASDAIDANEP